MVRRYALFLGGVLLLIGLMGFVDALTPEGRLLGLFAVNPMHNMVHLVFGLLGVWAGLTTVMGAARVYTWSVLVVFGLLTLTGFIAVPHSGMLMNSVAMNTADHVLHLFIAISALAVIVSAQRHPMVYR